MVFKKKLFQLNPDKESKEVVIHTTKRRKKKIVLTPQSNERRVRQILAEKLSGTHLGLWLLIPEYLRLGVWDLLKGCFSSTNQGDLSARMALQMANESALCVNRIRKKDSLCNQGFSLVNGLASLCSDESIHAILDKKDIVDYEHLQIALMQLRDIEGHYKKNRTIVIDPHRIESTSQRRMPKRKKTSKHKSQKVMQTFFAVDAYSGQPWVFSVGSSGKTASVGSIHLLNMIDQGGFEDILFVSDKEFFTQQYLDYFCQHPTYDILMPARAIKRITKLYDTLQYTPLWAGYAIGSTTYHFKGNPHPLKLIVQRTGEQPDQYFYKSFLTTSNKVSLFLLTEIFPQRWTIEEFFNFNGAMAWNRASTFNLHIRYGRQTMALVAQAAIHQLKQKLPGSYRTWTAEHTARQVLTNMEGDIRVKDDTILITYYRDHEQLALKRHFQNLPEKLTKEGVDARIPWLFNYKLDFRFK